MFESKRSTDIFSYFFLHVLSSIFKDVFPAFAVKIAKFHPRSKI